MLYWILKICNFWLIQWSIFFSFSGCKKPSKLSPIVIQKDYRGLSSTSACRQSLSWFDWPGWKLVIYWMIEVRIVHTNISLKIMPNLGHTISEILEGFIRVEHMGYPRTTNAQWSLFSSKSQTFGLEQTNFGVFSADLSAPILVLWIPCPCFPLINHFFYKELQIFIWD